MGCYGSHMVVRIAVPTTHAGFAALSAGALAACVRAVATGAKDAPGASACTRLLQGALVARRHVSPPPCSHAGLARSYFEASGRLHESSSVELAALAARIEAAALTGAVSAACCM